jgi:hypothetical protein
MANYIGRPDAWAARTPHDFHSNPRVATQMEHKPPNSVHVTRGGMHPPS